jgi:phosphatidylserine decarboxylase
MIYSKTGTRIHQPQSGIIKFGIHASKIPILGSKVSGLITNYCERFHERKNSLERIRKFAQTYKISPQRIQKCRRTATEDECWVNFETLNEFFIRKRTGLARVRKNKKQIVSPADCYSVFLTQPTFWIKGTQFTTSRLMLGKQIDDFPELSLFIFRLAPHHYHRFHCPMYGQVVCIRVLGTKYDSVDPILVQSFKNVYTNNVRMILEILNPYFGRVYMAIIGATCVGSIVLSHPEICLRMHRSFITDADIRARKNHSVYFHIENAPLLQLNEELGYFQYGGSTIVLGVASENIQLIQDGTILEQHTRKYAETEIQVGDILAKS